MVFKLGMLASVIAIGSTAFLRGSKHAAAVTAQTDCGPVSGTSSTESTFGSIVHTFRSIPYARPPVGKFRWSTPVSLASAKQCWNGTYDGSAYRPQCAQGRYALPTETDGDEDCLTLTVFQGVNPNVTLGAQPARLPVMVYIHGGDLTMGNGQGDFTALAAGPRSSPREPMVIVSIQYRLSVFGFFAARELASSNRDPRGNNVTGNYGFMDQQEALRWVQRNIHHFNGDPSRVTVFGQSSGGTSVLALVASPASKGLFQRALSLSGSPNITTDLVSAQSQHAEITRNAGCYAYSSGLDPRTADHSNSSTTAAGSTAAGSTAAATSNNTTAAAVSTRATLGSPGPSGTGMHIGHDSSTDDDTRVLQCLLGKSPAEMLRAVPSSWGMPQIFDIPRHGDGLQMPAVAVVDGVTLPKPVLESFGDRDRDRASASVAMSGATASKSPKATATATTTATATATAATSTAWVDVPLIISSMAQECGQYTAVNVRDMPPSQFTSYLTSVYGESNGTAIAAQYREYMQKKASKFEGGGAQYAFDSIAADVEMSCGSLALSRAAASTFSSPVYSLLFTAFLDKQAYATHGLDLQMAMAADRPDPWHAAPGARDSHKLPSPTPASKALGKRVRAIWYEFASTGRVQGWKTATAAGGTNVAANNGAGESADRIRSSRVPRARNTVVEVEAAAVWQMELGNNATVAKQGLKAGVCRFWNTRGFGESFWWSN